MSSCLQAKTSKFSQNKLSTSPQPLLADLLQPVRILSSPEGPLKNFPTLQSGLNKIRNRWCDDLVHQTWPPLQDSLFFGGVYILMTAISSKASIILMSFPCSGVRLSLWTSSMSKFIKITLTSIGFASVREFREHFLALNGALPISTASVIFPLQMMLSSVKPDYLSITRLL